MKILLTGASGLIGSKLNSFLTENGHKVIPFQLRANTDLNQLVNILDKENIDAAINLSGENIAGRWTAEKMAKIRDSRLKSTDILYAALSKTAHKPKAFVSASAIGFYGNRDGETVDENAGKGKGFLADLCQDWEKRQNLIGNLGIRVINLRIGIVLSKDGGALAKMLLPFQLGLGGEIGNGKQYMSWVDIDDVIGIINHILVDDNIKGPVNVVAPNPVTNKEFTKALGKVLHRPTLLPIPSLGLKIIFGPMADELLIEGQKVMPVKLQASNYKFKYADLESSLRHSLDNA